MSTRYGDKARSGEPVSNAGKRSSSAGLDVYEQEFVAPGTWTWPGKTSYVDLLLVGGGGGTLSGPNDAGGAGGVGIFNRVPVTAPVPVTVGAAGTSGPTTTSGGSSYFGPSTPPLPSTTMVVGGGYASGAPGAPYAIGGSAYGGSGQTGRYGSTAIHPTVSGGAGGFIIGTVNPSPPSTINMGAADKFGYGAGSLISGSGFTSAGFTCGSASTSNNGRPETAGKVIVRWYE